MPKLIIDDREIEVPAGTKVIEAAARLGIMIPRFCYHPALGAVGACRVCAVKFLQGPVKGIQMSCMIDSLDGMQISTTDPEAVDFRRYVIEWLMLHHPHDCPVCDEGGHCLLQDMTVSGGHGIRRYQGKKRTYGDQDLGPLVQHEMNRCIHCYRCSRFYQEFTGYRDLGALQIGNRTYFGRVESGTLESPFSGNLSDLCPTGVYTDRPSRFVGRRWDYERTPTVCINCSLGCRTVTSVRYRQVVRQEAHFSEAVNGWFICDRGRFGFFYAGLPGRPRRALVAGEATEIELAVARARERLEAIAKTAGPQAVAVVGSTRSSLETLAVIKHAAKHCGWREPVYFVDDDAAAKVKTAIDRLEPGLAVSMREIEHADCVLMIGADPLNEAPMLALALRQAVRNGARIAAIDPRPVSLPCDFLHIPTPRGMLGAALGEVLRACLDPGGLASDAAGFLRSLAESPDIAADSAKARLGRTTPGSEALREAAGFLERSRSPVLICGTDVSPPGLVEFTADAAWLLAAAGKAPGLFYLMPGANAFGAGLLAESGEGLAGILEAAAQGTVKALILVENDLFSSFTDTELLNRALARLEVVVLLDYLDSRSVEKAHIFLPTQTLFESGGIFVSQEGRAQVSPTVFAGGIPITQTGAGDHPPRVYGTGIPGNDPRPAWSLLMDLSGQAPLPGWDFVHRKLAETAPEFAAFREIETWPQEGRRIARKNAEVVRFQSNASPAPGPGTRELEIILTEQTYGTEELSARSACLAGLETEPFAAFQRRDAEAWDLHDGDRIEVSTPAGVVHLTVKVFDRMASGAVVIARHRRLAWQVLGAGRIPIRRQDIRRL